MAGILKFFLFFTIYGVVWFFILSIPFGKNQNLFIFLQKELKMFPEDFTKDTLKHEINKDKVIDALSKAFD